MVARGLTEWNWPVLQRLCLREAERLLGPGPDAEEAAQEAVLRAWRFRSQCRGAAEQPAWVRQIARREAWRLREARVARRELLADDLEAAVAEPAVAGDAERLPDSLDLRSAMRVLPALDRALLALRYVGDMTQPEVARLVKMREGTVKVRLHRARARLRILLESDVRE
ncbi:MAG: RNA polymerase sigma factor [Thermoleophilaceae bacterium]